MTLTDYTSKSKGPPEWIEEDQTVSVRGHVGEEVILELKLTPCDHYDDLRFELIRDGLPISSDRYRLSMRGNVVQLALKQSQKNDAGYYSLVATRLGQENAKGASKKIHVSIDETTYEEGDPPVFLRRLSDLAVKVGTRTRFLVEIRSATTPKIAWYKNDAPIQEGPRFSLVHEGNFHCVDVAPVTVEDQGRWTCMAENRSGRSSCTSNLTVVVPKAYKRPEFIEELRALLTETGTVSLECKVVGVPTPVLRWFKDNKEIKAGDVFALTANPDDPTSLGVYTCEAVNCMGTAYSSSKVHVVGRGSREGSLKPADALAPSGPLPIFKQILQDECCRIGDNLFLSCRVQVPPWPKAISWYNKGGRVESSEKYHIMEDGLGGYSIEVKQVEAVDEGEWKCVATSEESMKQFTSCYVAMSIPRNYRKPRFMENLKAVLTEEGLVSFECKVVGFPTPLLRWFKDGQELKPGDVYQLTGTNSLGSYCCIARNCMGEAKSTAELTIEDIQNQLNEEERFQLLSANQPPKFVKGLRSCEARISEDFQFTVQVSVAPEPSLSWYRDDSLVDESEKYHMAKENLGICHFEVRKLEFVDQAEWKCVAANDFGHSVTSCFLKLIIPKHYKKPKFLESLRAILSEEGAVNLECKVIGVPQPILKWYKDNAELKPGDIHRIISGQDGTCCLGTYTCEATNCMGTVSSSASLLGFEDRKTVKEVQSPNSHELARNLSLSTIHEERTSQLYDTPQTDHSVTLDERGEVSFSFDGKEVSVSLYETPDLTEEEALQIVEMYADQLSEHVTEHNVIELPPMRFVKETSTSGNLLMEAVVIDVSPDYFVSAEDGDDLRTEADFEDVSIMDDLTHVLSSPERDSRGSLKRSIRQNADEDEKAPSKPPRKKSTSVSSSKSEMSQRFESESFHSAQKDEPPLSPLSSLRQDDSDTFADALSSAHLSVTESLVQKPAELSAADNRKRSFSAERTAGSSLDDGIGGDSSFDSVTGAPKKKKQRRRKQRHDRSNSEEYSGASDYEEERESDLKDEAVDVKAKRRLSTESLNRIETADIGNGAERIVKRKLSDEEDLPGDLRNVKKATVADPSIGIGDRQEETRESTDDVLLEARTALHEALEMWSVKVSDSSALSNVRQRVDNVYRILEAPRRRGAELEALIDCETPLRALLKAIDEVASTRDIEMIRDVLRASVVQLSRAVEELTSPSLQPTLAALKKINESICSIPNGTDRLSSSTRSVSEESRNISEEIVEPLVGVQSAFSAILDSMKRSGQHTANGTVSPQQSSAVSGFTACLVELRECASHTVHTAMTLKENETLNSLMEFKEPLLDLQLVLASEEYTLQELPVIREAIFAVGKLQNVVVTVAKDSEHPEAISRAGAILEIVEDTSRQMLKLAEQLTADAELDEARKRVLKSLNIDRNLSAVHFALSSVLEKQKKQSYPLITYIEALRQSVGSSAITIANLKNPVDSEIIREIDKLNESLLNLQKDLLTEKHEPGEEEILYDLMSPLGTLKELLHEIVKNSPSVETVTPMLELLEEIEKDTPLIAKEISKKRKKRDDAANNRMESTERTSVKSVLANQISRSLDPLKHWLSSASEDSTRDDVESALTSTIEELKRDVSNIAIQTSYSEPPSDQSLIEALIDLREPLMRLHKAVSIYHEPEDLSTLEGLSRPMKHLLEVIMSVLREHAKEESLRPIVEIVKQIESQIPLSIKDALYQQEIKRSEKMSIVEMEEETITTSRETIPGTLTEIPSTPLEGWSTALPTEQVVTEDRSEGTTDDVTVQFVKDETQERERKASKLIVVLSETLEKLQLEMTSILEDFEESTTRTTTVPQSKLANSLEELRRTVSTIRVMTTVYGEKIASFEEKVNQTTLVLTNLLQPLTNIRKALCKTQEHDVMELMMLNRLTPLLNVIENDVIRQTVDFVGKSDETEKEYETLLCVLEEIKAEVPIVVQDISSRRKILECLRDISKPLESILERMSDLEDAAEEILETDVAKILGKPTALLLRDIKAAVQATDMLDKRGLIVQELRKLYEPLLEFHSCLSMVQSSRKSLAPEASLLEERRSVILRAVDGLRKQVCDTIEATANMEEASLFDESLTSLNFAILQVQKQIGKTDYSRRSSSTQISLQHRLAGTLSHLANTITSLEKSADRDTHAIVSKCLEALQKQISLVQMQFIQTDGQVIDEEAIVEGFLYPTNQLLSALNAIKENVQQKASPAITPNLMSRLRQLAESISEFSSSLSAHEAELVREGASKGAPIVETFSAVVDVLDHVRDTITTVEKLADVDRNASTAMTKTENVTDETAEILPEGSVIAETTPSVTIIEEDAQLKSLEEPLVAVQTPNFENQEALTRATEQTHDLADDLERREREEYEKRKQLYQAELSKFNSSIGSLEQPLRELVGFVRSATQKSLASKSEEDKRKIRELTTLIQILYDFQATGASVKAALSSSSTLQQDERFLRVADTLTDLERTIDTVISLTHGEVKPELKENILVSLQSLCAPLSALEDALASARETIDEDKRFDEKPTIAIAKTLLSSISETVKSLNEMQIPKSVRIIDEREAEVPKAKEEVKDIEETTARPLEELIEAIMDSQEQVKRDKTSPFESASPSMETAETKVTDDLHPTEVAAELNETVVDAVKTSEQQTMTSSLAAGQVEELSTDEKIAVSESLTEPLEQTEERDLAVITPQTVESSQSAEDDMTQREAVKVEVLRAIISPFQEVCKSLDEVGETEVSRDEKAVALSTLVEPLINLEIALNREMLQMVPSIEYEDTAEMRPESVLPQKLTVVSVLEELQKSIATVQEQMQLSTTGEASSSEPSRIRLMQAVEKPLEDLKVSIACIQHDTVTCQQESELSSGEQITVLQAVAKTAEEFGERCTSIIGQLKIEAESVPLRASEKEEDQKLDPDVLRKIVEPIHVLRETLSQIESLEEHKVDSLETEAEPKKEKIVQLSAVMQPLEKLERSLVAGVQQIAVIQGEVAGDLSDDRAPLESADLRPVLEELRDAITVMQQQAATNEDTLVMRTLSEAFEGLKVPLATAKEVVDRPDEVYKTEKVTSLLTLAKSMEETANQLLVTAAGEETAQQQMTHEISLLKMITIPIEGLQSAILKLEDRVSQAPQADEEATRAVVLECMLRPLQQLQQSFLTAPHGETALSLQRLPIKPTLDDLSRFVAVVQDQVMAIQDKLVVEASTDGDLTILKDFARSLGDLRTSTVVLQQLSAIENAGQQIVEIENASALQAFAKSIEEFRRCCSIVAEQPRIVEAFASTSAEPSEQTARVDAQLLENIIAPLRILQEQILTIEETKMQQSENLEVETRRPATVLSSLVGPLQQLEKSFVATVQKEHVIEAHNEARNFTPEPSSISLETLALQPILEEVQKSIATVQEHVILEAGSDVTSEAENEVALLKSIAQPLIELTASVASVQQVTAIAPDSLNELAQQQNVSALETFAETLHNLAECIAMCHHQQMVIEPADTISEGASSLNTWADVIEEPGVSKVTRPIVIDQGTVDSPAEVAMSISEDEASLLKTLAKPLTELRECLALIVEERKIIAPGENASSLSERENISSLKTMIQPLLELKNAAAIAIQEQMSIERASEHSFPIEGRSEFALHPLIEPLEELRHSIAVIQDQILVEVSADRPRDNVILDTLAEPLFDLQRAVSVLETRVMSPDVESMPDDTTGGNWITECLAIPLHEIERSIADIRQCTVTEPAIVLERATVSTPDWSVVEKLVKPMENIRSAISRIEDDSAKADVLKMMARPLTSVQENLTLLRNRSDAGASEDEGSADAVVESLSDLEKCISHVERRITDRPSFKQSTATEEEAVASFATLSSSLNELKRSIVTVEESPSVYLKNLERPLAHVQQALETVVSAQRRQKLLNISTKLENTISDINESIQSMERRLDEQRVPVVVEVHIECHALAMLTKPLRNIKECMAKMQKEPNTASSMIDVLRTLEKSMAMIREQSADKPLAESHYADSGIIGLSKNLVPCLYELEESIDSTRTLWHEETALEGLRILEEPFCKLQTTINIICSQFLEGEITWVVDKDEQDRKKKSTKKEMKEADKEKKTEKRKEEKKDEEQIRKEAEQLKVQEEKAKSKETEKTKKIEKQDEISIRDEKIKEDEIKREEIEKTERLKKQEETRELKKEKDEQKVETVQKQKELDESKETKEDLSLKVKEPEVQTAKEAEIIKKDEVQLKKDDTEIIKLEEKLQQKEEKTEKVKEEEQERRKIDATKKEESSKKEETAEAKVKTEEPKKKAESETPKKEEITEKVKENEIEKVKTEETENLEKKEMESGKTEDIKQAKAKEQDMKKEKAATPKKEELTEKVKEERIEKVKAEKVENLEKKKLEPDKKEEIVQTKMDKQKEETEKPEKEDEERKKSMQIEEVKSTADKQVKTKTDVQESKQQATQRKNKRGSKKIEKTNEEQVEKKKEEIVKTKEGEQQTQNEHLDSVKKEIEEDKSTQRYKEMDADLKQNEKAHTKQKFEEKLNKDIQELKLKDESSRFILDENRGVKETRRETEHKQHELQNDRKCLQDKNEGRISRSDKHREWKIEYDRQKDSDERLRRIEVERPEKKRDDRVSRFKREDIDSARAADDEKFLKRSEEKWIRREETARFLREEEQRLRRRREEEMSRNKQKRDEQLRESEWLKKRQNESDRFLRDLLESKYKPDKSTSLFFDIDYSRDKYISRFDSGFGIPTMLSSTSRSYSWRDSLTSLNRRRIDDYWDYKLRDLSVDKYCADAGSSYRRRRRRENRMIRARSTSLLKYEDYSTGDSDSTIVSGTHIRPSRRAKTEAAPRAGLDTYDSGFSSYVSLNQSESHPTWDKPKKPSFCTRLTNRIVGVGMRIRLTCTVLGNPEPRVHWTKDGVKLDATAERYRTRYDNGMAYLELHDALPEDAGEYTCVAENIHGATATESTLKVYSDYKPTHSPPTFVRSIRDIYRSSNRMLILECRVRAHPIPEIAWLKDGRILQGERYRSIYLGDDVYRLEVEKPNVSDNGQYTCRAVNELRTEEISHTVQLEDRDWRPAGTRGDLRLGDDVRSEVSRRPRFSNLLGDHSVPTGGTIALQVEVKGEPAPEVRWLRGDRGEPIAIPKAKTFAERGLHTLIVPEATESERGMYVCRAINVYGQVDTSATVDVISPSAIDGGKPAMFASRLSKKSIDVTIGEDVSVSFRVSGIPKPRVTWMKGLTDITDGPRSYKESIDDYVRLTLKRAVPADEGTYCILVKNRYGCDRCFFSIKVKQRARSLTPSPDWYSVGTERDAGEEQDADMSYVRNVPGPISSEPVAIDGGKDWLSLTWGKAERRGPAPVIAYKVEAWLLGSDGGARWVELGITPINAFDAFNLRSGGEYKFRVTPRNRYGWGEPVTMENSVYVSESTDLPEFTKILPGQLKALEGTSVKLECEVRGDPTMEVQWYRETTELDPHNDSRFTIHGSGSRCSLTIANVKEDDTGRYVCEASNRIGKVSSFARVLVVTDPRVIEADQKLRTGSLSVEPEDRPPQFTMRIRDRRVQSTYPVRLTCQVIGHPVPEITWYKNGTEISQDDRHIFWNDDSNFHTLEIIQSTLEDSGCYMATARNINGSVSCRCTLVVDKGIRAYIAPEFLHDLDAVYAIRLGGELRMSAQLEAYPSVGVVWHRDGIRLRPSRRAVMSLSHDGTVQFSLANVTERDAGVYSCTAANAVGHCETTTRVTVVSITSQNDRPHVDGSPSLAAPSADIPYSKEPLFVTKPLSTEAVEGDTVVILCEVVGDPKPEVIWLRDFLKPDYYKDAPHFRLVGAGPQYRLEIPYAKLDFTGTYSVIARNCHGEAKAVISLQIYAKGQGKEDQTQRSAHGKVLTLPIITRELRDIRCCDGDAVSLDCKVHASPEPPLVRWERGGKIVAMVGDFTSEFDGETARLSIQHVYPEDEGEYTCVAYNDLGKAYTSACLVVDVPEGKENILSQRLARPIGLLSAGSTPRSTPRSTPIRSLSPAVPHGREFRSPQILPRRGPSKRPKVCPPKFYAVPHNRLVQEGETVRFQCAVVGHPAPWVRWDKNGTAVTPSARISIKERDDVKILEITDVMREDAALYRVIAENDFGRIEASARLEVISRYEPASRTIRTRSASPRTYPLFDRSLLPTTGRINGRLQLECRVRGTPSVTPAWYRNGRPLERSARIKRHFDGTTAKIEITKVKASDAGEYTCVATNVLGSTRNSCQVTVLHPHDSPTADSAPPRFLQQLPQESIVMENHSYEFQAGVTGTPPFTVTWLKDDRELPDSDCHKYVIYGDGGVALRLSEVRPRDAGEYTCTVRNSFGVASCSSLFAVQDYKDVPKLALQFTKTPLPVVAARGSAACFCARVQCGKATEIIWTINGKDARESTKCKIERDGSVSVLRIRDVSSREAGEIRCTACVSGKGPSISHSAKLRLRHSLNDLDDFTTKPEDARSRAKQSPISVDLAGPSERVASALRRQRERCEESSMRLRSASFPRWTASCVKHGSPLPARKRVSDNASTDTRSSRLIGDPSRRGVDEENLGSGALTRTSRDRKLPSNGERATGISVELERMHEPGEFNDRSVARAARPINDERETELSRGNSSGENAEPCSQKPIAAAILKEPVDVTVFKGSRAVLRVTYQGCPEPTVKWLRVNRELQPDENIGITSGDGTSHLTLDDLTYDHAGKYEVSVENSSGKERRYFSLAVEGPPEPPADEPKVNLSTGQATLVWRSPPYDGGRTVIGYTVEAKRAGESTWMVITESCHSLSQTVPAGKTDSVVPGETYRFRVRAENVHGLSEPSIESDLIRVPRPGETMLQEENEDEFEPSFEARIVEPEERQLFDERFDVHEELGKGRYGIVKKVIERATNMCFAAKFVRTIKANDRQQVREEIRIMNALRHPKLLLLAAAYESPRETVMITEYISGGELFERVVADDFTLTEKDSMLFMRQICEGVEYMHQNKIVHLDLKPENIMCRTRTSHQIKLIDFGLAQTLKPDTPIRVLFGTPEFIPPEIISYEPIGTESDMWSVGVICYVLLTGLSPFMGNNDAETFANITRADYDLEDEAFDAVSDNAKEFISGLLIKRKEFRMSAAQCLEHPWMVQRAAAMSSVVLPTEKLKRFIVRRKWQKTGNAIRALGRMAMLSANSRRSPTTTVELSPTLQRRFEKLSLDDTSESVNNDVKPIETKSCGMQENMEIRETSMSNLESKDTPKAHQETIIACSDDSTRTLDFEKESDIVESSTKEMSSTKDEKNSTDDPSKKRTDAKIPESDTKLILENVATHQRHKGSDEKLTEKPSEHATPRFQISRRMFRGDSRDSGIGDCSSSQVLTCPLQVDELGMVTTIKEETDHETCSREGKRSLRWERETLKSRQSSTSEIPTRLTGQQENAFGGAEGCECGDKVATKSDVTKASCEINLERKAAVENTDAGLLIGRNRDKFLPTGNVSRTARLFEREGAASEDSQVSSAQRAYPAAIVAGKPYNERIQKAFAFWNK